MPNYASTGQRRVRPYVISAEGQIGRGPCSCVGHGRDFPYSPLTLMSPAVGSRIGHYEMTNQIGAGGMGEVFRATDTQLGRQVALKVLPESVAADSQRLARFDREARTLATLNHPNIAQIYRIADGAAATARRRARW